MRLKTLDVLRGIAVILVLGNHIPMPPQEIAAAAQFMLNLWKKVGWIGVDLFFVLSGFLVAGLLFREWDRYKKVHVLRFVVRRGFKIYPAFFIYLAILIALKTAYTGKMVELPKIIAEVCFIQNYVPGIWTHTWSLAIEEHFYILLAFVFAFVYRVGRGLQFRQILSVYVGVLLVVLTLRFTNALRHPYSFLSHSTPTHLRIDSLLFGVLLSYYYHFEKSSVLKLRGWKIAAIGASIALVALIGCLPVSNLFVHTAGYTLLSFGFGGILLFALDCQFPTWRWLALVMNALSFVGFYSYSIYLWHMSANVWGGIVVNRLFGTGHSYYIMWSAYMAGSVIVGVIMAKLVELPFLKIRDHFFPSLCSPIVPVVVKSATNFSDPTTFTALVHANVKSGLAVPKVVCGRDR